MSTELMAAHIALNTIGIESAEKAIQRIVTKYSQLEGIIGKYESRAVKPGKVAADSMSSQEGRAKTLGEAVAKSGEMAAQRQITAEKKLSAEQLAASRAREAMRAREEKAARMAEAMREREAAAIARRHKAEQADAASIALRRGMVVSSLAIGGQDMASVASNGASGGQILNAGANNMIQAVSLIAPQYAAIAAVGITVAQLAQMWLNVTGNTAEATKKAEEYRQVLAQAHAAAVAGSALVPGQGREYLKGLIGEQNKAAGLKVQLNALKAEEDRLRGDHEKQKKRAGAPRVFGAVTADAAAAVEESKTTAAQINAVADARAKMYAEWQKADSKATSMGSRTGAARFDQARTFRNEAAVEAAGMQGQDVIDRYRQISEEQKKVDAQRIAIRSRLEKAATDAEKQSLQQMLGLLDSEAVRLGTLRNAFGNQLTPAKEKVAEDKVFANKKAADEFLQDTDTDSVTNRGVKLIQDAQTVDDAESKIAFFRKELQREAQSPEFTGRRQGQLQTLIGAAVRRRDELLERERPAADTDEVLRRADNSRAGRSFSASLSMVDDRDQLASLLSEVNEKISLGRDFPKSTGFTKEKRDELMSEREAIQSRMDAIDKQKEQQHIETEMGKFRKRLTPQMMGFANLSSQIILSAAGGNKEELEKKHLEELRKQTGHLANVVDEVKKSRTTVAVAG